VTYRPATANYDAEKDKLDIGSMAAQGHFAEAKTVTPREMARWYAAGGALQQALVVSTMPVLLEDSDGQDFEDFVLRMGGYGLTLEDIRKLWEEAKEDVLRDLRNPAFRRDLWRRARELEKAMRSRL
jgi:hypothetical protein